MRIFLDTANVDEIAHINSWGIIEGITTNQKIFLAEKGVNFKERVLQIVNMTKGPVSVELTKKTFNELLTEAQTYWSWNTERITVKVAMSGDGLGLEVINALSKKHIPSNATVMMNSAQAMLAAKSGARFVSIFYRRCLDSGGDPIQEIRRTRTFLEDSKLQTEIIAGSLREVEDISQAFASGAHICTVPYKVLVKAPFHPKSEETIKEFDDSWKEFLKSSSALTPTKYVKRVHKSIRVKA